MYNLVLSATVALLFTNANLAKSTSINASGLKSESVNAAIDSIAKAALERNTVESVVTDFANIKSLYSGNNFARGKIYNGNSLPLALTVGSSTEASSPMPGDTIVTSVDGLTPFEGNKMGSHVVPGGPSGAPTGGHTGRTGNGTIGAIPQVNDVAGSGGGIQAFKATSVSGGSPNVSPNVSPSGIR